MKLRWVLIILSAILSSCEDAESQKETEEYRVESELDALYAEFNEVLLCEPHYLHSPGEMRAEYEEWKRRAESDGSAATKEGLAEYLAFIQRSEKKAERAGSLRDRIEEIAEDYPEIDNRVARRHREVVTSNEEPDPFR